MTDFVLLESSSVKREIASQYNFALKVGNYAKFLRQKPERWMFVPCDEKGIPLEKVSSYHLEYGRTKASELRHAKYLLAEEKCLFSSIRHAENHNMIILGHRVLFMGDTILYKTIEELVPMLKDSKLELPLTKTAINLITKNAP